MSIADSLDILYEDNHCLALNKPVGWPTTHFDGKDETVDRLAKSYLREKYHKPGNVFLGVVHRLDKPVSGTLLFAHQQGGRAAQRAISNRHGGETVLGGGRGTGRSRPPRRPLAQRRFGNVGGLVAAGRTAGARGGGDARNARAQFARVVFSVRGRRDGMTWLELRPHTGRKHQLRVQLAGRGCPVFGDAKYGSDRAFGHGIGLHARSLTFLHPTTKEPIALSADVPKLWLGRFAHLLDGVVQ